MINSAVAPNCAMLHRGPIFIPSGGDGGFVSILHMAKVKPRGHAMTTGDYGVTERTAR